MTVADLIAILQQQNPSAEVVLFDYPGCSFAKVREVTALELRVYTRNGMVWFHHFDDAIPSHPGTEDGVENVPGVLLA